jgi:hypothetical protein
MFEDFRKQIDDSSFTDDDEGKPPEGTGKPPRGNILGMSPAQRFIVSFMLLIMTVILGILFLMVTNKIALPNSL